MSFKLLATLLVLLLHLRSPYGHWIPHWPSTNPLCSSQFALVNRACLAVPFNDEPPPLVDEEEMSVLDQEPGLGQDQGHGLGRRRHRRRRHHQRQKVKQTAAQGECCRWLKEVDNICACDLLVHLPLFLIRPEHNYTVKVDESCSVTFKCGSKK